MTSFYLALIATVPLWGAAIGRATTWLPGILIVSGLALGFCTLTALVVVLPSDEAFRRIFVLAGTVVVLVLAGLVLASGWDSASSSALYDDLDVVDAVPQAPLVPVAAMSRDRAVAVLERNLGLEDADTVWQPTWRPETDEWCAALASNRQDLFKGVACVDPAGEVRHRSFLNAPPMPQGGALSPLRSKVAEVNGGWYDDSDVYAFIDPTRGATLVVPTFKFTHWPQTYDVPAGAVVWDDERRGEIEDTPNLVTVAPTVVTGVLNALEVHGRLGLAVPIDGTTARLAVVDGEPVFVVAVAPAERSDVTAVVVISGRARPGALPRVKIHHLETPVPALRTVTDLIHKTFTDTEVADAAVTPSGGWRVLAHGPSEDRVLVFDAEATCTDGCPTPLQQVPESSTRISITSTAELMAQRDAIQAELDRRLPR